MEEKTIFKASLVCSIIGILLIIFISDNLEAKTFNISDINVAMLDQEIKVIGNISAIRQTKGLTILTLKDNSGSIPVIVFKRNNEIFLKGSKVEITGDVSEFKNELQITAKQIKTLPSPLP